MNEKTDDRYGPKSKYQNSPHFEPIKGTNFWDKEQMSEMNRSALRALIKAHPETARIVLYNKWYAPKKEPGY